VNLVQKIKTGDVPAEIVLVVASRPCAGVERAKELGLDVHVVSGDLTAQEVETILTEAHADFAILAGYLRLIGVPACYRGKIVNIHPALLPKFGGKGLFGDRVHQAVLDAGVKVTGATVHVCDDRYDTGPILAQALCDVKEGDTAQTLAKRVFALECELYPRVIRTLIEESEAPTQTTKTPEPLTPPLSRGQRE